MTASNHPAIWTTLNYADARGAIDFLERAFGFSVTLVVPNDEDELVIEHCQMKGPEGGGIMLGSAGRDGNPFSQRPTGTASTYVVTQRPDELYDRSVAAGATVLVGLADEDYGSRSFSVTDPEGNIWSFGTYTGEDPNGS